MPTMLPNPEIAEPKPRREKQREERREAKTVQIPPYHVVLLDDDDHTYEYVIEMLGRVFGHPASKAYRMACDVDQHGRVVVDTTHRERAELKRDQIHDFGPDWRIMHCRGSMSAVVEPAA